jgi:hypothetical protein
MITQIQYIDILERDMADSGELFKLYLIFYLMWGQFLFISSS